MQQIKFRILMNLYGKKIIKMTIKQHNQSKLLMHKRAVSVKSQKRNDNKVNKMDLASKEIKNKIITIYIQYENSY